MEHALLAAANTGIFEAQEDRPDGSLRAGGGALD